MSEKTNGLMSKKVFDKLGDVADVGIAWDLVGKEVAALFAESPVIPIPFFSTQKAPCAPGFIAMKKCRSFNEWIKREPKEFLLTECIWDFQPRWMGTCGMTRLSTKSEDDNYIFRYEKTREIKGVEKTITVMFNGKEMTSLDDDVTNMVLDVSAFDNSYFDEESLYLVDSVYSINEGYVQVAINKDVKRTEIESRFPVGFKMKKLHMATEETEENVSTVRKWSSVNSKKWGGIWLDRSEYRPTLHLILWNQPKYGGAAGDVLGPGDRPFNFMYSRR